jgi:hypothetical protein
MRNAKDAGIVAYAVLSAVLATRLRDCQQSIKLNHNSEFFKVLKSRECTSLETFLAGNIPGIHLDF